MRGLWPLLIPTFAAGFGAAWWLKPEPPRVEHEVARPKVEPRAPGRDSGLREAVITPDTKLDGLADLRFRDGDLSDALAAIPVAEIPGLLAALRDRAGYLGLDYRNKSVLEKLVVHWFDQAPNEALLWVLSLEPETDREGLLRELVRHEAERDFDAALALARRVSGEGGPVDFLLGLQQMAADRGAGRLLELARLSAGKDSGSSGIDLTYPPDFDFRMVLDGLADLGAWLGDGEKITSVPSNLLDEWTRRDPQAAFEWISQGHEVPFNGMEDFVEAYAAVGGDREVGRLVGEIFKADEPHAYTRYSLASEALFEAPRAETLEGFLEAAGGAASREMHLAGLLDRSSSTMGTSYDTARWVIVGAMTPEQRLRLIPASRLSVEQRRQLVPELRRLGHGDEEIATMVAPPENGR